MHAHLCDEVELLHIVLAGEDGLAAQQLCHDAANRPRGAGAVHKWAEQHDEGIVKGWFDRGNILQACAASPCLVA
jgi:hypothetical protein